MAVRVLIAEKHPLVRQSLQQTLSRQPDIEVRVTAAEDHQALEAALLSQETDVVVMNAADRPSSTSTCHNRQQKRLSDAKLIVMSLQTDRRYVDASFRMGAIGYLHKSSAYEELPEAVRCVSEGSRYIGRDIDGGPQCRPIGLRGAVKG
jgi:DNA-binding NarL/FixJ family response regulator